MFKVVSILALILCISSFCFNCVFIFVDTQPTGFLEVILTIFIGILSYGIWGLIDLFSGSKNVHSLLALNSWIFWISFFMFIYWFEKHKQQMAWLEERKQALDTQMEQFKDNQMN